MQRGKGFAKNMKPYYEHAGITIYHGDCREVLQGLPLTFCGDCGVLLFDEAILAIHLAAGHQIRRTLELVVTDPPYGVAKAEWDAYLPTDWMHEAARFADVVAVMPGTSNLLALPERFSGLEYRWTLCVHLVNGMTRGKMGFGNWFPCVVYAKPEISLYREQGDAVDIAVGTEPMPDHPSPKPLKAISWIISRFDYPIVIDPFAGSGTTLVAAKNAGKRAIGIEIEEKYCEIAAKRLSQEVFNFSESI
jgi:16S rRNA G966 N2-methylase RsmD